MNDLLPEAPESHHARFLASMAHEFRTPLNAIIGFAEMLEMGVPGPVNTKQREALQHILTSGKNLLTLVNDVLDLARIESGRFDLQHEHLLIAPILDEVLLALRFDVSRRGVEIISEVDHQVRVYGDQRRVYQVLLNLISNALKYNRQNGFVRLSSMASGNSVRISVEDSGLGIEPAQQKLLFQPFERLGAEKTNIEGTGIGLVICKHLLEAMKGTIGFSSARNKGSCFWFELPASVSD